MSKNITIKKGGSAQSFNGTSRINVPRPDGSSANWVPEDECELGTIEISANGTYSADSLGLYGFHTVQVHVERQDYIVGYGQGGNAYKVSKDAGTGKLVKTEIPTAIEITTLPTKTSYTEGESIDYTGMVVKAKSKDGSVFMDGTYPDGIIPLSELTLPADIATAGKTRIPAFWLSPYTSRVLKTHYRITLTEEAPEEDPGEGEGETGGAGETEG